MNLKILIIIILLHFVNISKGFNILVLMPYEGLSHFNSFGQFFELLGQKGHNVTIISYSKHIFNSDNIRTITLGKKEKVHVVNLQEGVYGSKMRFVMAPQLLQQVSKDSCEFGLQDPAFQRFLSDSGNSTYDVVLAEFFITECFLGVVNKLNVPLIGLSSCSHMPWHAGWFGFPSNPAYIQNVFAGFKAPMSFLSRVENTLVNHYTNLWYKLAMEKQGNDLSKKYTGYEIADPHNASLLLVNTHYTIDGVKPLPPSIVEVGGIHVHNRKAKKLPNEIESWINDAAAGVIYFSLGSMIKSATFPEEQRIAFARAFAKFPQRVVWKWENNSMLEKPENVLIGKWMPQFDILCHPNVKLFISHGGLLGTIEAIHCGVPIIVMPQFGDQNHNAYAIEATGAGVLLHLQTATEELITAALKKGLDPQTQKNAKYLSEKFKDRPMSPMDTAIYWVEHVARHKGAPHMRSPAIDLPFYQLYLLDVYGFLVVIVLGVIYLFYTISRLLWRLTGKVQKLKTL